MPEAEAQPRRAGFQPDSSTSVEPYHWPALDDTAQLSEPEFVPISLHLVATAAAVEPAQHQWKPTAAERQVSAERILQTAHEQAEQIRRQVEQQVTAEAREKLEVALRTATEEQTAAFEQARDQLLRDARSAYEQRLAEIEAEMLSLTAAMAEKVIRRKLEADDEIVLDVVRDTLAQAAGANQVTVRISLADEPLVREAQRQLLATLGPVDDLQIVADEQISPGGCLVETERGKFDARIDTQLQLLSEKVDLLLPVPRLVRRSLGEGASLGEGGKAG
jgi:flagellar biosynthesis/type III secretory pathway protein FliH